MAGASRAIPRRIHGVRLAITATARSDRRIAVLAAIGVVPADQLLSVPDGTRVLVAGAVTHRQWPASPRGDVHQPGGPDRDGQHLVFTGVSARHRRLAQTASAMLIRGQVQNATGAVTVVAV